MTPEELERLARESNLVAWAADGRVCSAEDALTRFAALVRAQALEQAARLCDARAVEFAGFTEEEHASEACAAAIRALKEQP